MSRHPATRGFIPDFSAYLENHYPIDDAYQDHVLIEKLGEFLKHIITAKNPSCDLKCVGCKMEKMDRSKSKTDREFIDKCSKHSASGSISQFYYASFGNNPLGIAIGIDSNTRTAFFFALDCHHKIRSYHGKLG